MKIVILLKLIRMLWNGFRIWKEEDEKNNIKEEQKEDIQRFNKTMKTFGIDQDEVNRFKTSLETRKLEPRVVNFCMHSLFTI